MKKSEEGITAKKEKDFSEWYTQIVQKAELADLRYNIKGFIVFQPWSVLSMEKMFQYMEKALQNKGHSPYWFPTLIPEENLRKETSHIKGFTPEVFWVNSHGNNEPIEEKLALRPTSETAFYQMFALWIRSYKDLPFKTYQRANVFRYETKATRPFLRSREFHWIETHCAHSSEEMAMKQVREDMETTKEILHDVYGLPFIFFERPYWDKFPGAFKTFAADVLNPDGKVVQQPSTHILKQEFPKAFNVKFKDKDGQEKFVWTTCYGPAISRIFASVISVHGDDKGLKFPWEIAPVQVAIVLISPDEKIKKIAEKLKKQIQEFASVRIDDSEKSPGEKFNYWEMKGVPVRIDLGLKDLKDKKITIFRRDLDKKIIVSESKIIDEVKKIAGETTKNIIRKADELFSKRIINAKNISEIKKIINNGGIARIEFCSVEKEGEKCAEVIEKNTGAQVRGTRFDENLKKHVFGKCAVCGKKSKEVVYVAKSY
jgi:prolyl-tRNA synthetase